MFFKFLVGRCRECSRLTKIWDSYKSAVSREQQGQSAWFFVCWERFKENKSWFENL